MEPELAPERLDLRRDNATISCCLPFDFGFLTERTGLLFTISCSSANLNMAPSTTRILRTVATPTPFLIRSSEKRWITLVLSSPSLALPSRGSMWSFQIPSYDSTVAEARFPKCASTHCS
jgi:hypothetical protein